MHRRACCCTDLNGLPTAPSLQRDCVCVSPVSRVAELCCCARQHLARPRPQQLCCARVSSLVELRGIPSTLSRVLLSRTVHCSAILGVLLVHA